MTETITDFIVLRSGNDFVFHVPNPECKQNETLNDQVKNLFDFCDGVDFNKNFEVLLFKTSAGRLGVSGEEFTSWGPAERPGRGITLLDSTAISHIDLLNMKPAKGPGYCTITLQPYNKEVIIFFLTGSDRYWDLHFKKTEGVMKQISSFLNCNTVNTIERYNC